MNVPAHDSMAIHKPSATRLLDIYPYVALSLAFYAIYFYTLNQQFSFDAVTNAIACEAGEPVRWFHPNHLFYPLVGVGYYHLEHFIGYVGSSLYSLARLNAGLMAAALGIFAYQFSRTMGRTLSILWCALLGTTYAWWEFAVDGRAVGASMIWAVLILCELMAHSHRKQWTTLSIVRLSLFSILYIGFHGIGLFHLVSIFLVLYRTSSDQNRTKVLLLYSSSVIAITFINYVLSYLAIHRSPGLGSFISWSLGYAGFDGTQKALQSPFWSTSIWTGITQAFMGWSSAILYPGSVLVVRYVSYAAGSVLPIAAGWCILRKKQQAPDALSIGVFLLPWICLTSVFLIFWSPRQEGFWLHILAPIWVILGLHLASIKNRRLCGYVLALLTAATLSHNLSAAIYPHALLENNIGYMRLFEIRQYTKPRDVIVSLTGRALPGIEYLRPYFFPELAGGTVAGRLLAFRESDLIPLRTELKSQLRRGRKVFFMDDFFMPIEQASVEGRYGLPKGTIQQFLSQFRVIHKQALRDGIELSEVR